MFSLSNIILATLHKQSCMTAIAGFCFMLQECWRSTTFFVSDFFSFLVACMLFLEHRSIAGLSMIGMNADSSLSRTTNILAKPTGANGYIHFLYRYLVAGISLTFLLCNDFSTSTGLLCEEYWHCCWFLEAVCLGRFLLKISSYPKALFLTLCVCQIHRSRLWLLIWCCQLTVLL